MAVGFRPDPHPLGSSLHSFRQDFEDHKDTGEEERGERKNSVSEWDRKGKGHVVVKWGVRVRALWESGEEMGRKHRIGQRKGAWPNTSGLDPTVWYGSWVGSCDLLYIAFIKLPQGTSIHIIRNMNKSNAIKADITASATE